MSMHDRNTVKTACLQICVVALTKSNKPRSKYPDWLVTDDHSCSWTCTCNLTGLGDPYPGKKLCCAWSVKCAPPPTISDLLFYVLQI